MNNDLISREALKKELAKSGYDMADFGGLFFILDNAPIVQPEYFPPCEDCNKKMEEIRQAYDKMKAMERPQGKWIDHSEEEWLSNGEIFKRVFGIYATELWTMREADFLMWLNQQIPQFEEISEDPAVPKGEWIIVKDKKWGDNVKCPFCGKELAGTDLNFCCKCGAKLTGSEKMNGGADE